MNSLGEPIPHSDHAVSVSLPKWMDVIGYEEKEDRVISQLQLGYPRFVIHPLVQKLFDYCYSQHKTLRESDGNEAYFVFPSKSAAERAKQFVLDNLGKADIFEVQKGLNLFIVITSKDNVHLLKAYWQHSGEIISSRKAEYCLKVLENKIQKVNKLSTSSKEKIKTKISNLTGEDTKNIRLFPSGMAAIFFIHSILQKRNSSKNKLKTVQFGFPYMDTLKIQEKFSGGVHFFHKGDEEDLKALEFLLQEEKIAGLFTEFPTNPLLRSVDLEKLVQLSKQYNFPIVVDDTIATFANANLVEHIDILVTSLTKFFSGVGNTIAGSLVLSGQSQFYDELFNLIAGEYEDLLWFEDADVLLTNCQDFEERMKIINKNAETLCDFLTHQDSIERIHYPKFVDVDNYKKFSNKINSGYGGLFSIEFKNPEVSAPLFYDNLEVSKGPSLGTSYTLACPYTLLAHYQELEFVEQCGVSKSLVRVSVGTEEINKLIEVFSDSLNKLKALKFNTN